MLKAHALFTAVVLLAIPSVGAAQDTNERHKMESGKPMMGMDHGTMGHGRMEMGTHDGDHDAHMRSMHKKMQELHKHAKMMDEMKDGAEMNREMRKHMKIMGEMMEAMMAEMMEQKE